MSMSEQEQAKWYVIHTYSGHENKVKATIEKAVANRGMEDLIQDVAVPVEDVVENKNGKEKIRQRKVFPGYVLIKMIVTDESWYVVRNTKRSYWVCRTKLKTSSANSRRS